MEKYSACGRERYADQAAVSRVHFFCDQATSARAVDQTDNGVVAFLEKLGEFRDGGPAAAGVAGDAEQKLVLLGREAGVSSGLLAESQELPQFVAKAGELANSRWGGNFSRIARHSSPSLTGSLYHNVIYRIFNGHVGMFRRLMSGLIPGHTWRRQGDWLKPASTEDFVFRLDSLKRCGS
jgi:hypothetical protein